MVRAPLLAPLRDVLAARTGAAGIRAVAAAITALCALMAFGLVMAAVLVALSHRLGFPVAALLVAFAFAGLAVAAHLIGRALWTRRMAQAAAAQNRATVELAVAGALASKARPLLPLAAFLAAYFLSRR